MNNPLFVRPRTLEEALLVLASDPLGFVPLVGGTDLLVRMKDGLRPKGLLDLTAISELVGITVADGMVRIGAATTHAEIASSREVQTLLPALAEAAALVGSPAIRNRGTIGGNLANASPAADTVPPLLALSALVELAGPRGRRTVPVEAFAVGPGKTVRGPDELIVAVAVPVPGPMASSVFCRLGTRQALSIAKVSVALAAQRDGPCLRQVRVALGAVGPTVLRATGAEACLEGKEPSLEVLDEAAIKVQADARPISDIRSTEAWRRRMCGVLLRRAVLRLVGQGQAAP